MEQILPAKANKQDISHQLASKANIVDIKSTMAEIAANIESKVSYEDFRQALDEKLSRSELSLRMDEKVSFEDMKRYVALTSGSGSAPQHVESTASAAGGYAMATRQFELIDEELRRLKERVEDTFHQLQSLRQIGGGPSSQRDHTSF